MKKALLFAMMCVLVGFSGTVNAQEQDADFLICERFDNYEVGYTRIIEHKHFEFNDCKGTIITEEVAEGEDVTEKEIATIKASLKQGNHRFNVLAKGLEIIMRSVVALIEFEQNYCMSEHKEFSDDLKASKKELNSYLSSLNKGMDE